MPNAIITAIMFVGNLVMTALPMIEVVFGIGPCFELGGFVLPLVRFFFIEDVAGVHVFHVDLDFAFIVRINVDGAAVALFAVQLLG